MQQVIVGGIIEGAQDRDVAKLGPSVIEQLYVGIVGEDVCEVDFGEHHWLILHA